MHPAVPGWPSWLAFGGIVAGALLVVRQSLIQVRHADDLEHRLAASTRELQQYEEELEAGRARAVQAGDALDQSRREAERANESRRVFLATMSHEIRAPMNAILGYTHLLQTGTPSVPAARQHLKNIDQTIRSLLRLINEVLDFSRIEAGHLDLQEDVFRLDSLLQKNVQQVRLMATVKGLALSVEIAPEAPAVIYADPLRLGQVLLNLLTNAVKFTESGQVDVRVTVDAPEAVEPWLRVAVCDTGVGIEPESLPDLFGTFAQSDSDLTHHYGGTGLGLAVCKQLMAGMGGEIGVESTPGQGSTFWFRIPLKSVRALAEGALESLPILHFAPASILLMEDNSANQWLTSEMLRQMGLSVVVAPDGKQGLTALESAESPFDLILMDLQMPELDGYAASQHIRERFDARALPIVAMTAFGKSAERQRCFEVGMNAHLTKPVALAELGAMLARFLPLDPAGQPGAG